MKIKLDLSSLPTDRELDRMFKATEQLDRYKVGDKAVRAGAKPLLQEARRLTPDGRKTGNSQRRLKAQASEYNWDKPLKSTIRMVIRKYGTGAFAVVGPKWREGNKAYFNTSPRGRRRKIYGKDPVTLSRIAPQIRNWIVQAYDVTRSKQLAAMKESLRKSLGEAWKNG